MVSAREAYARLGAEATSTPQELKRAYLRALRDAHPDRGGSLERFTAVQEAWAVVESLPPVAEGPSGSSRVPRGAASPKKPSADSSRLGARSHGHPGGWFRERFGMEAREWLGRGVIVENIFDPDIVNRAPATVRHILQAAIAEEETAAALARLGPAFEVWHDVVVEGSRSSGVAKIDHVVLGPSRLWAIQSEDWGSPVEVVRREIVGEGLFEGEKPAKELVGMVKKLQRSLGVRFSAIAYVVPDSDAAAPLNEVGTLRGLPVSLVQRGFLRELLEESASEAGTSLVGDDMFELREQLRARIRFV